MDREIQLSHRRGAEDAEGAQRKTTGEIVGAAIEVHRTLGPGLLESVYQEALQHELALRGIPFVAQRSVPVVYKRLVLQTHLRVDLIVDDRVIVEIKSIAAIEDVHRAQLLTYLRLTSLQIGLLINFNVTVLKTGIKRLANTLRSSASSAPLR